MEFKKLSFAEKTLLKLKDKDSYKDYKFLKRLHSAIQPDLDHEPGDIVHFRHSGNAGDIIYALPAVNALAKGRDIHMHLYADQPGVYKNKFKHPLGKVMLNAKMVEMLKPLLEYQAGIKLCDVFSNQKIDYDLDIFRSFPPAFGGNIARWYFLIFAEYADLSKPWLTAPLNNDYADAIVVGRSFRYRTPGLDYRFLQQFPRTVFVGMEDEYKDMQRMIPELEFVQVKNFLELASVINGSKMFIGNQSFPFSIAEGLKKKRLLEVSFRVPNVQVEGNGAYDFSFQPQFEKITRRLFEEN